MQPLRLSLDDGDDAAGWRYRPGLIKRHGKAHNGVGDAILIVGHVSEKLGSQVWTRVVSGVRQKRRNIGRGASALKTGCLTTLVAATVGAIAGLVCGRRRAGWCVFVGVPGAILGLFIGLIVRLVVAGSLAD